MSALDRFTPIHQRSSDLEYTRLLLQQRSPDCTSPYHGPTTYEKAVAAALFGRDLDRDTRVLPISSRDRVITYKSILSSTPTTDWRVKEAATSQLHGIVNDVYNHSFALSNGKYALCGDYDSAYLFNLTAIKKRKIFISGTESEIVSATHWITPTQAAVGTNLSTLNIIDGKTSDYIHKRSFERGTIRVIDQSNENEIYLGFADGAFSRIDPRDPKKGSVVHLASQTISSLSVRRLTAVGYNQNMLMVFDPRKIDRPFAELTGHKSAVTSVEWLDDNHLISGGGSADKSLRAWCMINPGKPFMTTDTKSQVTGIHKLDQQTLITTHGSGAENDRIQLWSIENGKMVNKDAYKTAHSGRIVNSAMSNSTLITGSGIDSVMCIWKFTNENFQQASGPSRSRLLATVR